MGGSATKHSSGASNRCTVVRAWIFGVDIGDADDGCGLCSDSFFVDFCVDEEPAVCGVSGSGAVCSSSDSQRCRNVEHIWTLVCKVFLFGTQTLKQGFGVQIGYLILLVAVASVFTAAAWRAYQRKRRAR